MRHWIGWRSHTAFVYASQDAATDKKIILYALIALSDLMIGASSIEWHDNSFNFLDLPLAPVNSPSEVFPVFIRSLEKGEDLQSCIAVAENPQQIMDIAESTGFANPPPPLELLTSSSDLSADCFHWSAKGNKFLRNFFEGKG